MIYTHDSTRILVSDLISDGCDYLPLIFERITPGEFKQIDGDPDTQTWKSNPLTPGDMLIIPCLSGSMYTHLKIKRK